MNPIDFKGSNVVFAKDQPQYLQLPAHVDRVNGVVTSCWKLTWKERLKVLITGKMFISQLTFNKALQPISPAVNNPVHEI